MLPLGVVALGKAKRTHASAPTRCRLAGPHYVGIDENGMGPRLGPLVVTSVLATVDGTRGAKVATSKPRGAIAKRIGDSKKLVAFDDSALGEAWARAIAARGAGVVAREDAGRAARGGLDRRRPIDLRAPCPSHHVDLCWGPKARRSRRRRGGGATARRTSSGSKRAGSRVVRARVAIVVHAHA